MADVSYIDRPFAPPLTEDQIQRAVFAHIRKRGAPGIVAFHPKNGGVHQRGRRRGINAGLGVRSGVSDIIILHLGRFYALELKRDGKKVDPDGEQSKFLTDVVTAGGIAGWASGLEAAIRWLEQYGLVKGAMR